MSASLQERLDSVRISLPLGIVITDEIAHKYQRWVLNQYRVLVTISSSNQLINTYHLSIVNTEENQKLQEILKREISLINFVTEQ